MKKIVYITGCLGFIGSHVTRACLKQGWHVRGIDKCTYAANLNLLTEFYEYYNFEFENEDINDLKFLYECDYVINTAAETHVGNSIADSDAFVHSNIDGVHNLLNLIKNYRHESPKLPTLLHFSTDEVYGDMEENPNITKESSENYKIKGSSYYSASKAASDLLVEAAGRTYGLPYLITRTCNNFGEHQFKEKFLPTIAKSISEDKEIPVYGDGEQIREWMYVYDNVKIICDLMFDSSVINTVYNIGTGFRVKNIDIVKKIAEILGKEVKIKHVEDRLGHDRVYNLDCSKLDIYYMKKDLNKPEFLNLFDYLDKQYKK